MDGYNTNEEVKRLKPEGHLRSKAQQVIHGLHGKKSPKNQQIKPKNPVVIIAEKVVEGIKKVVDEVSSLIPGDSSQQEVKMYALEQFRQKQAARKAAAEGKEKAAKEALVHSQIVGLQKPVTVDETGRLADRKLSQAFRNKLRAAQASGSSAVPKRSVSPPKWTMLPTISNANKKRAEKVRKSLQSGQKSSRSSSPQSNEEAEEAPGSEENVSNNQKGMASQNKPANAVAAGNAAASAAAAAGASPAVVNATANAVANAVANAPPGQEGQVAAAAAEEAVVAGGGNVQQAAAASEAAASNAGGNANAEADRIEQEAAAQQAALAVQNSGAPPAAVEAAANAVASGAPPAAVEAAVVNAGGSPAAAANASAVASNAGAANRLAALSPVLPPSNGGSPGAGVVANAPAILGAASAAATNSLVVPGPATSPLPVDGSAPCPPVGLAPGTYAATVQRTMTGETAVTFKSTGPQGKGTSWSMPGFSLKSGVGKTVKQQVEEQPKATWTWKGINFGESLKGLKGFVIDLTPLLIALQAVGTVAGGAIATSVGGSMFGAYLIGQGFVLVGLAIAGAFQALAGLDFRKIYPGITLANLFGLGTDPRMKKLAKAISEYQTLNKQGIQQVVNAAKQARSSRFSNNAAVQNRVEAEIKTVKRLLAGKQSEIKAAAKGLAKDIGDALYDKLELKQKEATAQAVTMNPELQNISDKDFEDLELLIQKIYLAASALGNVPEAQYPMVKAEAIKTAFAQFLKDVQVLDELQQLAQGSNAKASVNKMWNKTQKYRSNAASYGRAAQQGLSGFGSRIGSMFTRKTNASKPNSSGYVPGVVGSNPAAPKKGFFGRLGNSLKSAFSRKPSAAVQKLTAAPANGQNNGSFNKVNPMRNAFTSPQAAAAGASGERLYVQPRASAPQAPSRGFFGRVRNTLGVPRGLTLKKGKEGNYSGFGRNVPETENAGESQNPFGLTQGAGNAYEALNRANAEGKRPKRKTQKRKAGRR
uniref:Uncharacterized protein n=1 Tax=viral metagenome TaxID=1070528 RepID=A0A6C0BGY4_9ZZZZ